MSSLVLMKEWMPGTSYISQGKIRPLVLLNKATDIWPREAETIPLISVELLCHPSKLNSLGSSTYLLSDIRNSSSAHWKIRYIPHSQRCRWISSLNEVALRRSPLPKDPTKYLSSDQRVLKAACSNREVQFSNIQSVLRYEYATVGIELLVLCHWVTYQFFVTKGVPIHGLSCTWVPSSHSAQVFFKYAYIPKRTSHCSPLIQDSQVFPTKHEVLGYFSFILLPLQTTKA